MWHVGVSCDHATLHLDGTAHRVDHACKLYQHSVASSFDDPPVMFFDLGIDEHAPMCLQLGERTLLIGTHQPTVASDVGCENSSQSPFNMLFGHIDRPAQRGIEWSLWPGIEGVYQGNDV
jgi:hypothetical protein